MFQAGLVVWGSFIKMNFFFTVNFFIKIGGADNLDLIALIFFASALSLKVSCLTHAIFFLARGEWERRERGRERRSEIMEKKWKRGKWGEKTSNF